MMKIIILLSFLLVSNLVYADDRIFNNISAKDTQIFVDRLLRIGAGKSGLEGYREWSELFAKFTEPLPNDYERMAAFQLFSFISVVQAQIHPSEMATEITQTVFENNPELFIEVLNNNLYLSEVVCRLLLESVTWKDPKSVNSFIDKWKTKITKNLRRHRNTCEEIFDEFKSNQGFQRTPNGAR